MAETRVPTGLTVQQWDEKYFTEYQNQNFFKKFIGSGSSKMIQVKEDLTKKPGDAVTFTLFNRFKGEAKDNHETLEGNEEDADLRSQKVTVRAYDHAVKWSAWEAQKTAIDLRQGHKDELMTWNSQLDKNNILRALASINGKLYTSSSEAERDAWAVDNEDRVLYGAVKSNFSGDHSVDLAKIDTTTDILKPDLLSLMKRMAKTADPKIRPITAKSDIGGSDVFVVFAHTNCIRDLAKDADFRQANRDARERGINNPLFTGANYIWDNLLIYEIEDIVSVGNVGASSAPVYPVYLCGAQALGMAWAMRPKTVEDDTMDYGRKVGLAIKQWYKVEKLRFGTSEEDTDDPKDHGIVTGYVAAAADA